MPYKDSEKQKAAQHKSYLKNIDKNKEKNKTYRQNVRDYVRKQKESQPCMDCGIEYPYYIMEYDHIKDNKLKPVSYLASAGTMNQVIEEINKCDLVCSNCHKSRTWIRLQK